MFARLLPVPWTRIFFAVLAAVCLLACPVHASAAQTRERAIEWQPCHEQFQCATVRVPLDYDRPRSGTISIALTRLPATDPARRIGSLFLNPGGPGGSGVDFVLGAGPFLYTDEVRARFDLVGFDPRGIMRSSPLRCFDSPEEWGRTSRRSPSRSRARRSRQWIAADRYLVARVRPQGGPRSSTTCRRPTWRATWTCCAPRSATDSSATPACPTAPTSA